MLQSHEIWLNGLKYKEFRLNVGHGWGKETELCVLVLSSQEKLPSSKARRHFASYTDMTRRSFVFLVCSRAKSNFFESWQFIFSIHLRAANYLVDQTKIWIFLQHSSTVYLVNARQTIKIFDSRFYLVYFKLRRRERPKFPYLIFSRVVGRDIFTLDDQKGPFLSCLQFV